MTNAIITISLVLTTNWTGVQDNGKELGYVSTNHVAQVMYQGATNEYILKTCASEKARWRDTKIMSATNIVNMWYYK